jgi:hypothetical protein
MSAASAKEAGGRGGGSPWAMANQSVVISVHNKNVSVLSKIFQLLEFSVTQIRFSCCTHIL